MSAKLPSHLKNPAPASGRGDFGSFGLEDMAYVKLVEIEGQTLHAIHAADGTPLTVIQNRALAFATVRQYEMEPLSVH
ncbi:MAG TPA: DUF1150 family protein [Alphaproteobacteria bacterium]|nr:DUF1150 family protein [Alphaproteobacteria bacterium]